MTDTTNQSLREQAEKLLAIIESTDPEQEPFYIDGFVRRLLAHYGRIAVMWEIEDVLLLRDDLTHEQAMEVLERARDKHDPDWGISRDTLSDIADALFSDAPETDEAAEA
jgi:hypothetical protein